MSPESAYFLRRQPGAESFRRAWEAALDFGIVRLKDIALERAIEGDLVPVIAGGKLHGYRRVRNDRLLMFAIRMNDRAADGRRHGATHFQPRTDKPPPPRSVGATITLPDLSESERQDAAAAHLAAFVPATLAPQEQAALYAALAAEAGRRADLLPALDPAELWLTPDELEEAGLAPMGSPYGDATQDPLRPPHERPWYRLHDEAGARAIDEAVAQVKAAKAAGAFDFLDARREGNRPKDDGRTPMLEAPAPSQPDPPAALSPRTGKPLRPYRKRTPKPPFEDPFDDRNDET